MCTYRSALAGCTAGRELHPAPKVDIQLMGLYLFSFQASNGLSVGKCVNDETDHKYDHSVDDDRGDIRLAGFAVVGGAAAGALNVM